MAGIKRIRKVIALLDYSNTLQELLTLNDDLPIDCSAGPFNPEDLFNWKATIIGQVNFLKF